jgi:simple sugar transport system permease protein
MMTAFLVSAAPLLFASLGALFTELSGSLGIFIEGFINIGAFLTYVFMVRMGSVFAACCSAALIACMMGWLLARFVTISGANPFIAGLALNLIADGLTRSLSVLWFGTKGVLRNPGGLSALPSSAFVVAAVGCFALAFVFVTGTTYGFRLRAAGLSPLAAEERGIHTARYREGAWAVAAALAALAGACLTARVGAYTPGGAAGRGWIALAAVYLGFRTVGGTALAALVFAAVERIGISLQSFGAFPATALLSVPSVLAFLFYVLSCLVTRSSLLRKSSG